ncbi:hypothetical protein CcI49_11260 [Frankia sp. CcI49]|nr:hypothetical protein [Frankia sp. CcI49]ONH60620.1 hypothetical protein CcI49_11260 [Frankia sp. CcI49]
MTTLRGLMRIRLAGREYGGKDAVPTFPAIASRHRGQGRGARRRASVLPGYGCAVELHLSQIDEVDELLTNDRLALLIGMALDRQCSER